MLKGSMIGSETMPNNVVRSKGIVWLAQYNHVACYSVDKKVSSCNIHPVTYWVAGIVFRSATNANIRVQDVAAQWNTEYGDHNTQLSLLVQVDEEKLTKN